MHPDFLQMRIDERQRELEEQVRSAYSRAARRPSSPPAEPRRSF